MPEELPDVFIEPEADEPPSQDRIIKTINDIRERAVILSAPEKTYIIVLAIHEEVDKNSLTKIHCKKGVAIPGYAYDAQTDAYHIECYDYLPFGYIPVSFFIEMPGAGRWRQRIPIPESAIKGYFSAQQKRDLRNFKSTFKGKQFTFQFIQLVDAF